ncbi:hypothetical protein PIB30_053673 [Stylosanthes scabra]|uniref:Uncharacterized protein n=1 Tax=Stylosanthes scabra TaxID=79078 RepID=A0ABU6TKU8_9FABA|nr:hypothetical protein [Stylosanthes scabra]
MDQVRHFNPVVNFSVITLDTRWDPKGQRIYNPKEEVGECSETVAEVHSEQLEGSQRVEVQVPEETVPKNIRNAPLEFAFVFSASQLSGDQSGVVPRSLGSRALFAFC